MGVYSELFCSFSEVSTNLLGTGFWIHQYAERGAAHHLCLLQCPGKGVVRQKPKGLIWPLCDMVGVFMAIWMVAYPSGKFLSVLAYSPKQVTSKLKLPFYSSERFLCKGRGRLQIWRLTVVSPRILCIKDSLCQDLLPSLKYSHALTQK